MDENVRGIEVQFSEGLLLEQVPVGFLGLPAVCVVVVVELDEVWMVTVDDFGDQVSV